MIEAGRVRRRRRLLRPLAVGAALAAGVTGCASAGGPLPLRPAPHSLAPGSPLGSRTLSDGDAWLRHYLIGGEHAAALQVLQRSAARPRDRLLRSLQEAVVHHYAGGYAESNRLFEWAEQEADRRYTRSVSRGIGALVVNDNLLAYTPSAGEMAIIPYYRMLNYLAAGRMESAVVEARKSSAYLAWLDARKQDSCAGFGLVQYMAGLVYGAAGERNDALVSLRQAERSFTACAASPGGRAPDGFAADLHHAARSLGLHEVADSVAERYDLVPEPLAADEGDLIVLLEHGFAAHRVQQDVFVPVLADEVDGLDGGETAAALSAAGRISARLTAMLAGGNARQLWEQPVWNPTADYRLASGLDEQAAVAYVLRLAWPVMRLEASRPSSAQLVVDGAAIQAPLLEDVSGRLVRDLESRRTSILTRMIARGLIKYVASRGMEEAAENKAGEALGALVGLLTNTAGNLLEQADTRSWSLLPDQIAMARIRVPAGEREVRIQVLDSRGGVVEEVDLGRVTVRPGERVFVNRRVWGAEAGDRERLIRLGMESYESSAAPPAAVEASRRRPGRPRRAVPFPALPGSTGLPTAGSPPSGPIPVGLPN